VGLAATVLTIAAAFFFDFPTAGLMVAIDLGSGFLSWAAFHMAGTLGCFSASVTV
jgi:hypothetical protein